MLSHVIFTLKIELVGDQVQCILIVLHFCLQPSQVETISQVFLVNFAKIFMTTRRDELSVESMFVPKKKPRTDSFIRKYHGRVEGGRREGNNPVSPVASIVAICF